MRRYSVFLAMVQVRVLDANRLNPGSAGPNGREHQCYIRDVRLQILSVARTWKSLREAGPLRHAVQTQERMPSGPVAFEKPSDVLRWLKRFTEDGFRAHGKRINKAKGQYRKAHGQDSVTPEVEAEIRTRFGAASTRLLEARARISIRDDLPMLESKPNSYWAADMTMGKRASLESGGGGHKTNPDFIAAALLDVRQQEKAGMLLCFVHCPGSLRTGLKASQSDGGPSGTRARGSGSVPWSRCRAKATIK